MIEAFEKLHGIKWDDTKPSVRACWTDAWRLATVAAQNACKEEAAAIRKEGVGSQDGRYDWMADGAERCAEVLRSN